MPAGYLSVSILDRDMRPCVDPAKGNATSRRYRLLARRVREAEDWLGTRRIQKDAV